MIEQTVNLTDISRAYQDQKANVKRRIVICAGTGCVANGSLKVHAALVEAIEAKGLSVTVDLHHESPDETKDVYASKSGCQGFCQAGPLLSVEPDGFMFVKVKPEDVTDIVEQTLIQGKPVERLVYKDKDETAFAKTTEIPFYERQNRYVLGQCGYLNPEDIREYIAEDGYAAARKAFLDMTPKQVCDEVEASGLRGRGGGGFPTGRKWALTLAQASDSKYVICNGDEGDPGAFMDRSLMEGNPHRVIEGMMITARAIGVNQGYVYVRAEYPLAVRRMKKAVDDAMAMGLLGDNLFGTDASFYLSVMEGAGAFVCGEETALIASIEGQRGMPRPKPPFPAQSGLYGKPTVINNVETLATVPLIIQHTSAGFRQLGTQSSPGTKTFALTGHVVNTGLIEVPFGTSLRKIIFDIGGGVTDQFGNPTPDGFKAVQIGGPSGGCLTEQYLDLPLDFDTVREVGAMVGSGGLVVMNQDTCMVQVARFFMQFTQNESCGKCVPCREGTKQLLALLDDVIEGRADEGTLALMEDLAKVVQCGSLCGLGKTAPNPVLSTLEHFRAEYEAHVLHKRCPTGQCKALAIPEIVAEACKGCTACARKCPVGAITGERKQVHTIDADVCIKCGACVQACKFNAIVGIA